MTEKGAAFFIKLFYRTAATDAGPGPSSPPQRVPIKGHRTMDEIPFTTCIVSRARELPTDAEPCHDAFAFAETCMDTLVTQLVADEPSVICMHPECSADATRAVTWYFTLDKVTFDHTNVCSKVPI
jgi:hypothetical protein